MKDDEWMSALARMLWMDRDTMCVYAEAALMLALYYQTGVENGLEMELDERYFWFFVDHVNKKREKR